MKRLVNFLLVIVIVLTTLGVKNSVEASTGKSLADQKDITDIVAPENADSTILHVKAPGDGDCSSWQSACKLQTALANAVAEDEIWVAAGIHYPDEGSGQVDNDQASTFSLKDGVAIYGGFVGDEGILEHRDWKQNITVLSGDIDGNDTTDINGVITDTANITGTNSLHVVTISAVATAAILDGFTITSGSASGYFAPDYSGGGLYSVDSNSTLVNLTISGNEAAWGGGINNRGDRTMILIDSTIGPGNNVVIAGGGLDNSGNMLIKNSTVAGNSGTGINGGAGIQNTGILTMTNSTVSNNVTMALGGGILVMGSSLTTLNNCTITDNMADVDNNGGGGGGIGIYSEFDVVRVKNSIIANNGLGVYSPAEGPDVYGNFISLGYNLIGNSSGSDGFEDGENHDQVGSDAAPIDPVIGDLNLNPPGSTATHALLAGSPAIDKGSCAGFFEDQRGALRPSDVLSIPNEDDSCDIGTYEVQTIAIDFEGAPLSGAAPLTVNFTNLSSGEYDSCHWDFGDGYTSDACSDPDHVYEQAGTYTVRLTVNGAGGDDSLEKEDYIQVVAYSFLPVIVK